MKRMWSKNELKKIAVEGISGQNITPANISASGIITGEEIIENMSGYLFNLSPVSNLTIDPKYFGVCKNGNKITIVVFFGVVKTEASGGDKKIVTISIPSSIGDKLVPFSISHFNDVLDAKNIECWDISDINTQVNNRMMTRKNSNTEIYITLKENNLVIDTEYLVRYEVTFLLSDNLIPAE